MRQNATPFYVRGQSDEGAPQANMGKLSGINTPEIRINDNYGYSQKCVHGYVVLEWLEEADETFLAQLNGDSSVIDYCVYTVPSIDDFPFGIE